MSILAVAFLSGINVVVTGGGFGGGMELQAGYLGGELTC